MYDADRIDSNPELETTFLIGYVSCIVSVQTESVAFCSADTLNELRHFAELFVSVNLQPRDLETISDASICSVYIRMILIVHNQLYIL